MGSFNGSGVFVRSYSWTQDAANGIDILAPRMDTEDNGFAGGLTNCVTRDGQSPPTANLPMGNFRITGLSDPSGAQDAMTKAYGDANYLIAPSGVYTGNLSISGTLAVAGDTTLAGALSGTSVAFSGNVRGANFVIAGQATTDAGTFGFTNSNGPGIIFYGSASAGSGALLLYTSGVARLSINAGGGVSMSSSLSVAGNIYPGSTAQFYIGLGGGNPVINVDTDDYYQYTAASNIHGWYIGGTLRFKVEASGPQDANGNDLGYKDCPQNAQSGTYTLVLGDRGKDLYLTGSGAVTIPPNSSVAFPLGTTIAFTNDGSARTLTQGSGVTLKWAGVGTAGNRILGSGSMGAIKKVGTDTWYVSGAGIS